MCSLKDLQTHHTLDDLADMHEAADIQDELARRAKAKSDAESARNKGRRR